MTVQELIIGHYEGTLTAPEQRELQGLLSSSPETQALFDRHGKLQESMEEESRKLVPPIALREATIVGALGVAAESIGGGLATWLTAKMAALVGSVIVVGTVVGIIATNGDGDKGATSDKSSQQSEQVQAVESDNAASPPAVAVEEATDRESVEISSAGEASQSHPVGSSASDRTPVAQEPARPAAEPATQEPLDLSHAREEAIMQGRTRLEGEPKSERNP